MLKKNLKKFLKFLKKVLTFKNRRCNIKTVKGNTLTNKKKKEVMIMKFRVYFKDGKYWPTFFRTKREAIAYQAEMGGEIQRLIGGEWIGY
ncbi:MAG: hypothetical protein IJZ62_04025 [Clostridia bacterium]|nr:hypothetical protein [Clostridia bacterium]